MTKILAKNWEKPKIIKAMMVGFIQAELLDALVVGFFLRSRAMERVAMIKAEILRSPEGVWGLKMKYSPIKTAKRRIVR